MGYLVASVLATGAHTQLNDMGCSIAWSFSTTCRPACSFAPQCLYLCSGAHSWSIINRGDPVTQHGKFMFLYKRPGQRVLVGTGDMLVAPTFLEAAVWRRRTHVSIAQHVMGAYRKVSNHHWAMPKCTAAAVSMRQLVGNPYARGKAEGAIMVAAPC